MTIALLNDRTITRCRLTVPGWGLPFAEVEIDGREELGDNAVTLRLVDLEASMTVVTSGSWRGRRRYRLVSGSGGWGEEVPAQGSTSDLKVLPAAVAAEAAAAAGELIDISGLGTASLGGHWTRQRGPAARVLELLAPQSWYVDLGGTARFGSWPEVDYTGEATRVDLPDRAVGRIELAPDNGVFQLVPGAVVDGNVAVDVEHRIKQGALRTSLWIAHGASSRLLSGLARLVRQLTARHAYHAAYSYRVVSQDADRLDLQPERSNTGMPWLQRVRARYWPGLRVDHQLGSLVVVQFLDGDPARPVVVGGDDPESAAWLPETIRIDADGDVEVAGGVYPVLLNGQAGLTISGVQPGPGVTGAQISIGVPPVPPPAGPARLFAGDPVV